jgi:MFS family permease
MTAVEPGPDSKAEWPNPWQAWGAVAVLFLAYALAFVDRTILTLLVGPIRADLHISDTQVSLLHGFAFAIFYTVVGIPIARLADVGKRRNIIALSAVAWSITCCACGLAKSFWSLFLARIGVGIGEAGLSPAAYSMMADLFPEKRLSLAMSVYTSALYLGAGLALIIGGAVIGVATRLPPMTLPWVGTIHPWQLTFFVVGLPGLLVGALMLTVKEPVRRTQHTADGTRAARLAETFVFMRTHIRAYAGHILGFSLISVVYNASVAWAPAYLIRQLGISTPRAGYLLGVVILLAGIFGVLCGGLLADTLRRRGRLDATLLVGVISVSIAAPTGAIAFLVTQLALFLCLFAVMLFTASMAFGAAAAGIQVLTPNRMRAQASAAYLFTLNLLAVGAGPTFAALLTDYWFHNDQRVGDSVTIVICLAGPLAVFALLRARHAFVACAALTSQAAS